MRNSETVKKISEGNKHAKKGSIPVIEKTSGKMFGSAFEAARHFCISLNTVLRSIATNNSVINGNGSGLIFEYVKLGQSQIKQFSLNFTLE
jgi:hypothetical protein